MAGRQTLLEKRLGNYWKLELINIALVPIGVVSIGSMAGATPGWLSAITVLPNMLLLAVGGLYWRAKLHRLQGRPETMDQLLPIVARCRLPAALLTAVAVVVTTVAWLPVGPSGSLGDRVMATVFSISALLELINYYWRQLQHFDHKADLKRLFSGQGFRPSHLARDLARWQMAQ